MSGGKGSLPVGNTACLIRNKYIWCTVGNTPACLIYNNVFFPCEATAAHINAMHCDSTMDPETEGRVHFLSKVMQEDRCIVMLGSYAWE